MQYVSRFLSITILLLLAKGCDNKEIDSCEGYPSWKNSQYILPYPVGNTYLVLQGNCSDPNLSWSSHFGHDRYSYDFEMEIGTIITAARSGTVVFVREEFSNDDKGIDQGNVVVLLHSDSTYAAYGHLDQNGVIPMLGEMIDEGDTIGVSGNSGLSSIPHLHFHVSPCLDQAFCGTLPITFRNTSANPEGLILGERYTAKSK